MKQYDIVVIGGGPGGYVAAIRAAQLGLKTVVVDNLINKQGRPALGGTCLNVGCIPSKALLDSSHHYSFLQHDAAKHGIQTANVSMDVARMIKRKDEIVSNLTGGVAALFLKHKIDWLKGTGTLVDANTVDVVAADAATAPERIRGKHIIIATGSRPRHVAAAPVDQNNIVDSTGALEFDSVPKQLAVIGGGVVGLELGSVWQRLGSDVTLLVRGDQFLAKAETAVSQEAMHQLTKQGLNIVLGAALVATKSTKAGVTVTYRVGSEEHTLKVDKVLVSVGREPNTDKLNASGIGLQIDKNGFIVVDEHCKTNLANVYAIGDVVRGPMLAHKASEEGIAVVERISGQAPHVNFNTIPWVIYTQPEIAWVGATSQELTAQGIPFHSGSFPFKANGRAHSLGELGGFVKILAHAQTDRVLGVHIIGPGASEMIAEAVMAMEFDGSAEDIARTVHAHPTLSEAFHEAALGVAKRTLHI
jgi:dihydrolipoamide dehydrogenase